MNSHRFQLFRLFWLSVLAASGFSQAQAVPVTVPVSSSFDTGFDGWTPTVPAEFLFVASGGNSGGYVRFEDITGSSGQILAPAKFLGDWTALDGTGQLAFDHRLFETGFIGSLGIVDYEINISGGGNTAMWTSPGPSGETGWVTLTAPIMESQWTVTGSWTDLLESIAALRIRVEMVDNDASRDRDIAGIDNIVLTGGEAPIPEPSSLVLLCVGFLLMKSTNWFIHH